MPGGDGLEALPAAGPAAEGPSISGRCKVVVDDGGEGGGEDGDEDADEGEERREGVEAPEGVVGLHGILEFLRTTLSGN